MTSIQKRDPRHELKAHLEAKSFKQAMVEAVPATAKKYLTPERIIRIVMCAANGNKSILACRPETIMRSVIDLVQLGLEPGGPLGQAYLVPYKDECRPIVGYQGYLALARRSGEVESVFSAIIYQGDKYRIRYGNNPVVRHEPLISGDRGPAVAVYCVAKFKGGGSHLEVMTVQEVEDVRRRSRANNGPWSTDWGQMARKTVIRRARHYWPMSIEMATAFELDERSEFSTEPIQSVESEEPIVTNRVDTLKDILASQGSPVAEPVEEVRSDG
jgi:recombination protein RecT